MTFDPQDPRLTAYVLGELSADERLELEALLRESPEGQALVDDISALSTGLFAALQREAEANPVAPQPGLRQRILASQSRPEVTLAAGRPAGERPKLSPAIAFGATAAALAIVSGLALMSTGRPTSLAHKDVDFRSGPRLVFGIQGKLSEAEIQETLGIQTQTQHDGTQSNGVELAGLVANFNEAMDRKDFSSAQRIAQQAQQVDAKNPVTVQMQLQSRFATLAAAGKTLADGEFDRLHDANSVPNPGAMTFTRNWSELRARQQGTVVTQNGDTPLHLMVTPRVVDGYDATPADPQAIYLSTSLHRNSNLYTFQGRTTEPSYQMGHHFMLLDEFEGLPEPVVGTPIGRPGLNYAASSYGMIQVPTEWHRATLNWDDGSWYLPTNENLGRERVTEARVEHEHTRRQMARRPQVYAYYAITSPDEFFDAPFGRSSGESYAPIIENDFVKPENQTYSTFSIDVDTASYANVRRFLQSNQLPPANAIRLEELVNAFEYDLPQPDQPDPLTVVLDGMPCPWQPEHQLVRIALSSREIPREDRPPTSLVFLIDVSGSMQENNKLPLAQQAMQLLTAEMREDDQIAIVTYANEARVALPSTNGSRRDEIIAAIAGLQADGSTNGEGGLNLAYETARKHFIKEGVNRVLLCTDGDFNVGTSDDAGVFKLIEEQRQDGVFLSVLGFGTGNLKDSKLEGLADKGNGHYSYIDSLKEARKVLVEELTSTLYTVAKDVKLQVEFNPDKVARYRLLGYENRTLAAADFNNDKVDAGELGAGHRVTALYEVVPTGAKTPQGAVDPPRYGPLTRREAAVEEQLEQVRKELPHGDELAFVKVRYKQPDSDESNLLQFAYENPVAADAGSVDQRFAAALAEFGLLLRNSQFKGTATWDQLLELTRKSLGDDQKGRRTEFLDLVLRAKALSQGQEPEILKQQTPPQQLLGSSDAREKAACEKKYTDLLDKWEATDDFKSYGDFFDLGYRNSPTHGNREGLPAGYWVYVYPNWYIWGERVMR